MPGYYHITSAATRLVAENIEDATRPRSLAIAQRILRLRPIAAYSTLIVSEIVCWLTTLMLAGTITTLFFEESRYKGLVLFIILIATAVIMTSLTKRVRRRIFLSLHQQTNNA